jgi:hypothetical protein
VPSAVFDGEGDGVVRAGERCRGGWGTERTTRGPRVGIDRTVLRVVDQQLAAVFLDAAWLEITFPTVSVVIEVALQPPTSSPISILPELF